MSDPKKKPRPKPMPTFEPTRKDRLRPTELLVFAGILAVFTGVVVLLATREPILAVISLGIAFIVSVVIIAMLSLGFKPNTEEVADLDEQNRRKD